MIHLDTALEALSRDPATPFDLAEISLLVARDEYSSLDVEAHLNELEAMAHEVKPYLRGHLAHRVQGLCRYLFHEMGFRGNQRDYYDPRNSYFNQVLERRLGIPIALSAVTMAVGARCGLVIDGVGLPGHFIVRASDADQEILIDPFAGGRILSVSDCEILVQQATGMPSGDSGLALAPIPLGLMLQRMLNNLRGIYMRRQDWPRSIRILERLRQLCPGDVVLRRDLGLCQIRNHQPGRAIDHLRSYLREAGEAEDIETISQALKTASNMVAQWN